MCNKIIFWLLTFFWNCSSSSNNGMHEGAKSSKNPLDWEQIVLTWTELVHLRRYHQMLVKIIASRFRPNSCHSMHFRGTLLAVNKRWRSDETILPEFFFSARSLLTAMSVALNQSVSGTFQITHGKGIRLSFVLFSSLTQTLMAFFSLIQAKGIQFVRASSMSELLHHQSHIISGQFRCFCPISFFHGLDDATASISLLKIDQLKYFYVNILYKKKCRHFSGIRIVPIIRRETFSIEKRCYNWGNMILLNVWRRKISLHDLFDYSSSTL